MVEKALALKLDIIAVCDHNASGNVQYVKKAAAGCPLIVLPGIEVTSKEEVHTLALFDNLSCLNEFQQLIDDHLFGSNREEIFGCQVLVNELDEVEGFNDRFLLGATTLSLPILIEQIHQLGGLAIASHIDREGFSVLGQLGFIPPDCPFDALEVTGRTGRKKARDIYLELAGYTFIEASDAHRLEDIGQSFSPIWLEEGTISELKMAFAKLNGRYVE